MTIFMIWAWFLGTIVAVHALTPIECRNDIVDPRCNWSWKITRFNVGLQATRPNNVKCGLYVTTGQEVKIFSMPFVATDGKKWNFDYWENRIYFQFRDSRLTTCPTFVTLWMPMTGTDGLFTAADVIPGYRGTNYANALPCQACYPDPLILCDTFGCCPVSNGPKCTCPDGTLGPSCDQTCLGDSRLRGCTGHGTCRTMSTATDLSLYCYCDSGFFGTDCGTTCPKQCSGRGSCIRQNSQYVCVCDPPFAGPACEVNLDHSCQGSCNERGVCIF